MQRFFHTGDLGDIIASLPTVRELDGGEFVIGHRTGPGFCRESMKGARFEAIRPLLETQPYIKGVSWGEPAKDMHDFSTFRKDPRRGEDLATWQARHIGVLIELDPWLTVTPSPISKGRTVIARSNRYHNPEFNWKSMMGHNALFVGTMTEHLAFENEFGRVEYLGTENLLSLAEVIAGSELFIGNQSCPFWLAAAMGVNLIQETSPKVQDSIIRRPNALYPMAGYEQEMA